MKKIYCLIFFLGLALGSVSTLVEEGFIPCFPLESSDIELKRLAQPLTYFDKTGHKFAILGYESGSFEAWAYPLKILRNFEFSFLIQTSTQPIQGKDIVRLISATPAATVLTFAFQSFTVKAIYITAIEEPGAFVLLEVDTIEPLTIICSFIPVLQPMWPAGIGGQYSYWDNDLKAYIISEPTGKNHGFVGSPAGQAISYTPAHMLSDSPNQFKIVIEEGNQVKGKYIPIILAGGKGKAEDVKKIYESLRASPESYYRAAVSHYQRLRQSTLQVKTPDKKINLAFEWAKITFDNLIVDNPDLGKGLVAGLGPSGAGGRPGFGWFFSGDAYINSLSLSSLGAYPAVKEALAFTQKWQRQDGKMCHELSQAASYINWFKDYPYGYIHGDTTPFYIVACQDYLRMTGDVAFIKQSWESLKQAYDWCLSTDEDGDGLMDNKKAGLGALEFGSLIRIQTDIYLAAIWTRACYAMERLALAVNDNVYAKKAKENFRQACQAFDLKFWDDGNSQYSYAFNSEGKQVRELTPWPSLGLMWKIGDSKRSFLTLEKINSAELTTDWGVRTISSKSSYFEPLNYNYGAVWPFVTGWAAAAQFKHNFALQGYESLMSVIRHTFDNALGCVTEVFSGHQNIWPQEAVCHQGFSTSGFVLPLVRGMLGLEGDVLERQLIFEPCFRPDWNEVLIENYRIGEEAFSFRYERKEKMLLVEVISEKRSSYQMTFAPCFGPGTKILSAHIDGEPVAFKMDLTPGSQVVKPIVRLSLTGKNVIEIDFVPGLEILPPDIETQTGDSNKGLKIIKIEKTRPQNNQFKIILEGLGGQGYFLSLLNRERIKSVEGAELNGNRVLIQFAGKAPDAFLRQEILITLK